MGPRFHLLVSDVYQRALKLHVLFFGMLFRGSNARKLGDHFKKKKFFINNSLKSIKV